jgi:hypothetical protein
LPRVQGRSCLRATTAPRCAGKVNGIIAAMIRLPTKRNEKNLREEDSRMLKYVLLGLAVLYVAWAVFKAVMGWIDRRREQNR